MPWEAETSASGVSERRVRGSFMGLAVCDALGAPVEFKKRGTFAPVTAMRPNDNFDLGPGCFTDDTSMALCLAHSLLACHGRSDTWDQVTKYLAWWQTGYMSSVGRCFDIGVSTRNCLANWSHYAQSRRHDDRPSASRASAPAEDVYQATITAMYAREEYCGNGSLMRVLPTALMARTKAEAQELARQSSMCTHPHPRCLHACMLYVALVYQALHGAPKAQLAASLAESVQGRSSDDAAAASIEVEGVLRERLAQYRTLADWEHTPSERIRSSGYVVDSLEAALWAFFRSVTFEDGAIMVVNLGDDADTVGAIYGGLAGAFYGVDAIPPSWLVEMVRMDLLDDAVSKMVSYRRDSLSTPSHLVA